MIPRRNSGQPQKCYANDPPADCKAGEQLNVRDPDKGTCVD